MSAEKPRTVLAASKSLGNLRQLQQLLSNEGYETTAVNSIPEFDTLQLEDGSIGVAIVDIGGFDRAIWECCERLRTSGIPFIVISPREMREVQQGSLAVGASRAMTKPVAIRELIELVNRLMEPPK